MNVNNIANGSLDFTLSGKVYKIKRLNIMDLYGEFEAQVKKQYMDDIISLANRIENSKERIDFQRAAIKDIPKGKELEQAVNGLMDSFEGGVKLLWLSLNKLNNITLEEAKALILDVNNQATITNIMGFITGNDQEAIKEPDLPKEAIKVATEKKMTE